MDNELIVGSVDDAANVSYNAYKGSQLQDATGVRQCPKRRSGAPCSPYAINPPEPWRSLQGGDICVHCGKPLPKETDNG